MRLLLLLSIILLGTNCTNKKIAIDELMITCRTTCDGRVKSFNTRIGECTCYKKEIKDDKSNN